MLCSKCKTFSTHLSNYDSFICEYGHVICRTCSEQAQNQYHCSVCNGKIIRQTEFHLQGTPKIIFNLPSEKLTNSDNVTHNCNQISENVEPPYDQKTNKEAKKFKNEVDPDKYKLKLESFTSADGNIFDMSSDSEFLDSSTVMQHLSEFRRATNYVAPSHISTLKVHNLGSFVTAAIATEAKTPKQKRQESKSAQTQDCLKVDAGTSMQNSDSLSQKKFNFISSYSTFSRPNCHLRDKLKDEIYSCFKGPRPHCSNSFMIQGDLEEIPPHILFYDATATANQNYFTQNINVEVEKALKNLNIHLNLPFRGHHRRDEIVKQSKYLLRQKLLEEIYMPFDKSDDFLPSALRKHDGHDTTDVNQSELQREEKSAKREFQIKHSFLKSASTLNDCVRNQKHACTIGSSTESYPKLSTNFSITGNSENVRSNSFTEDAYILDTCIFDSTNSIPRALCNSNTSSKGNSEVQLQFDFSSLSSPKKSHKKINAPASFCGLTKLESDSEAAEIEKRGGNTVYFCETFINNNSLDNPLASTKPANKTTQVGDCLNAAEKYLSSLLGGDNVLNSKEKHTYLRLQGATNFSNPSFAEVNQSNDTELAKVDLHQDSFEEDSTYQQLLPKINIASRAYFPHVCTAYALPAQYKSLPPLASTSISNKPYVNKEIPLARELNMPRSPIICPVTSCRRLVFVTEFSNHIKFDHSRIHVESIYPGIYKNVFMDTKLETYGVSKCHVLFLLNNKIRDLGSKDLKDYLPVVLMSTTLSVADVFCVDSKNRNHPEKKNDICIMIWLTGITIPELPVYYNLIIWSRKSKAPQCHIAHTGQIYSIRNNQDFRSIFKSGQCLLLKYQHWKLLSNDGKDMLELQVVLY